MGGGGGGVVHRSSCHQPPSPLRFTLKNCMGSTMYSRGSIESSGYSFISFIFLEINCFRGEDINHESLMCVNCFFYLFPLFCGMVDYVSIHYDDMVTRGSKRLS